MKRESRSAIVKRLALNSFHVGDFIEVTRSNDEGKLPKIYFAQLLKIEYLDNEVVCLDMILGTDTGKGQRVSSNALHIVKIRKLKSGEILDRLNNISWSL